MNYTDAQIWNACRIALRDGPVELSAVAKAARLSEREVAAALIRESRRGAITFRFPPLPCAAVVHMSEVV